MRTLEAWGAMIENDHRAYYTAGGRIWMMDLEPSKEKKPRLPGTGPAKKNVRLRRILLDRRHAGDRRAADVCAARPRLRGVAQRATRTRSTNLRWSITPMRSCWTDSVST